MRPASTTKQKGRTYSLPRPGRMTSTCALWPGGPPTPREPGIWPTMPRRHRPTASRGTTMLRRSSRRSGAIWPTHTIAARTKCRSGADLIRQYVRYPRCPESSWLHGDDLDHSQRPGGNATLGRARRARWIAVVVALVVLGALLVSSDLSGWPVVGRTGTIEGTATAVGLPPPRPRPQPHLELTLRSTDGVLVAQTRTDARGHFRFSVSPGTTRSPGRATGLSGPKRCRSGATQRPPLTSAAVHRAEPPKCRYLAVEAAPPVGLSDFTTRAWGRVGR